jgi:hypothetical protein
VLESLVVFKDHRLESLEIILLDGIKSKFRNPENFLSGLQNLTSLTVKSDDEKVEPYDFMQVFLPTTTTTPLPLLTSLTINEVSFAGDNFMVPFVAAHPRLESIVLIECYVHEPTLYAIADHLPRLRHLKIHQNRLFFPRALEYVVHHCPALDKIYTRSPASIRETMDRRFKAMQLKQAAEDSLEEDEYDDGVDDYGFWSR